MMIYPIDLSDKIDLLESLKKTQGIFILKLLGIWINSRKNTKSNN